MAKKRQANNEVLEQAVEAIDDLREFERFRQEVLPALRADLTERKLSAEQIYKKYSSMAAARGITIALTTEKPETALTAIRDILDRTQGKPVQRSESHHTFEELSDEELDAMVLSEMENGKKE